MISHGICPNRILSTNTNAFHRPISRFELVQIINKQKHLSVWSGDNVSDACVWQGETQWVTVWTHVFGVIVSLCLWRHGACGSTCLHLVVSRWQTWILCRLKATTEMKPWTRKQCSLLSVTIPRNTYSTYIQYINKCHFCWEPFWKYFLSLALFCLFFLAHPCSSFALQLVWIFLSWSDDRMGIGHMRIWSPTAFQGSSEILVHASLFSGRVVSFVQSGHTVDNYSEALFNPETAIRFLIYIFHRLKCQLI